MPEANKNVIINCFKQHSPRAYTFYQQCTKNSTLDCTQSNKQELHVCLASLSQAFVQKEKCGQILNEATIKCLAPQLTDQIELCFIRENLSHGKLAPAAATATAAMHTHNAGQHSHQQQAGSSTNSTSSTNPSLQHHHIQGQAQQQTRHNGQVQAAGPEEVIVQSPKPAKAFLKQFEYANYDTLFHACDPELEFDQQITTQEMTEIQALYTISSTLCRDECLPSQSKKLMRDCLLKNSPRGAQVFNQCTAQFGQVCGQNNEESLTACFNTIAQNMTMNEKCVELVSDTTQKCWSQLIKNETTHCVERKNLQTVSFECK